MGDTPLHSLPYPEGTDQPYVHLDMQALADEIDTWLYVSSSAAPAHKPGRRWHDPDDGRDYISHNSSWKRVLLGANAHRAIRAASTTLPINTWNDASATLSFAFEQGGVYLLLGTGSFWAGGASGNAYQRILAAGVEVSNAHKWTAQLNVSEARSMHHVFTSTVTATVDVNYQAMVESPSTGLFVEVGAQVAVARVA